MELAAGRLGSEAAVEDLDGLAARLRALDVFAGELPHFAVDEAPSDPADLFVEWLEEAIAHGVPEPHVMTLSTVDDHGLPQCTGADSQGHHERQVALCLPVPSASRVRS